MKNKFISVIASVAVAVSMLVSAPISAKADAKAYSQIVSLTEKGTNATYTLYEPGASTTTKAGFTYDASSNTLTIKNVSCPAIVVNAYDMGKDFKIRIWGENYLAGISVTGEELGTEKTYGCLRLTGSGKLHLNEDGLVDSAINVDAGGTASRVIVEKRVTFIAKKKGSNPIINVANSTRTDLIIFDKKNSGFDNVAESVNIEGEAHTHKWEMGKIVEKASSTTKGKAEYTCYYCGKTSVKKTPRIAKVLLEKYGYRYNGKAKKPKVIVIDENDNEIPSTYYKIKYSNNVNKGMAKVTVTFKGMYDDLFIKQFVIG